RCGALRRRPGLGARPLALLGDGRAVGAHLALALHQALHLSVHGNLGTLRIGRAGQEGLEPPTAGFGDRCSAKLSYCPLGVGPLWMCEPRIVQAAGRRRRPKITAPAAPAAAVAAMAPA